MGPSGAWAPPLEWEFLGCCPSSGRWILLALGGSSGVPSKTSLGGERVWGPREDNLSVILPQAGFAKMGEDDLGRREYTPGRQQGEWKLPGSWAWQPGLDLQCHPWWSLWEGPSGAICSEALWKLRGCVIGGYHLAFCPHCRVNHVNFLGLCFLASSGVIGKSWWQGQSGACVRAEGAGGQRSRGGWSCPVAAFYWSGNTEGRHMSCSVTERVSAEAGIGA